MFEKSMLGGTCINWGCIPSKTLIHAALLRYDAVRGARVGAGGGTIDKLPDGEKLFHHREAVVNRLRQERYLDLLDQIDGLELVKGNARLLDSSTVGCDGRTYHAGKILIAVGGNPRIPQLQGLENASYLTSRSALQLRRFPASLVIIGGGVVAVELGQMFHRLGCGVTILEHGPRLLPVVETELSAGLEAVLINEGIKVVTNAAFCSVGKRGDMTVVSADLPDGRHDFTCERLLLAAGTEPATAGIGLEQAGVAVDNKGFILVDDRMRTSVPGIWGAGDAIGKMMIATVGAREGIVAADDMFNPGCGCSMDYRSAPMAIFTDPEVAMVGYGETEAINAGFDCMVNVMPVSAIPKAHVVGQTEGVIKMIAERSTGRLLGVHLICHRGADLINEAALAIRLKATVDDLAASMHVYPSIGEGLRLCAQGFRRDISLFSCCAE
jgi:mercuric reductase